MIHLLRALFQVKTPTPQELADNERRKVPLPAVPLHLAAVARNLLHLVVVVLLLEMNRLHDEILTLQPRPQVLLMVPIRIPIVSESIEIRKTSVADGVDPIRECS